MEEKKVRPGMVERFDEIRNQMLGKNKFREGVNQYSNQHPDAISDGDEYGRGLGKAGTEGTSTDIAAREEQLRKNFFSPTNPYDQRYY